MGKFYAEVEGMIVTEPEQKEVSGGKIVMSARLACTERIKDKASGEWKNGNTIFMTVVDFNETLMDFVKKDIVIVKGRLSLNKWQGKDGADREELKLFADEISEFTQIPRT